MRAIACAFLFLVGVCTWALAWPPFSIATLGGRVANVAFTASGTTNSGTYSFGTAASNRVIAVGVALTAGAATTITGVTIGGISATRRAQQNVVAGDWVEIWTAPVPLNGSGTVTVTASSTINALGIAVYALRNVVETPTATLTTTSTSGSLAIGNGGVAVAAAMNVVIGGSTYTWGADLTEDSDFNAGATTQQMSTASRGPPVTAQTLTVSATASNPNSKGLVAAAWRP